jgi:hypothetical protein
VTRDRVPRDPRVTGDGGGGRRTLRLTTGTPRFSAANPSAMKTGTSGTAGQSIQRGNANAANGRASERGARRAVARRGARGASAAGPLGQIRSGQVRPGQAGSVRQSDESGESGESDQVSQVSVGSGRQLRRQSDTEGSRARQSSQSARPPALNGVPARKLSMRAFVRWRVCGCMRISMRSSRPCSLKRPLD